MYYFFIFLFELIILYFLSRKLTNKIWLIFYKLTKSRKWATYIYSFLFLPGIIVHELAHFLIALFLLVPVGKFSLGPKFDEDGQGNLKKVKLGSVAIGKTDLIRGSLIGFAPFIFGVIIILLLINFIYTKNLFNNWTIIILVVYIIFEIGNCMFLSSSDVKTALELVLAISVLYIILYLLGIRFSFNPQGLLTQKIIEILKSVDKFLLVPLGIDFLLFGFTKIF